VGGSVLLLFCSGYFVPGYFRILELSLLGTLDFRPDSENVVELHSPGPHIDDVRFRQ